MKVARPSTRPSLRQLLPPAPRPAKPSALDVATDKRLQATVDRVRGESERAAIEFLDGEPADSARPLGKAGSLEVKAAAAAGATSE